MSGMYYDLSLLPGSLLELNHLLGSLKQSPTGTVAIDYELTDCTLGAVP